MTVLKAVALITAGGAVAAVTAAYAAFGAFLPWREEQEAERLARLASVLPGQTIAEIGAGTGRFTTAMARRVGAGGTIFSTELNPERRRAIHERVTAAGLENVEVIEGAADRTNLPDNCCDVIFLRNVYHHIQQPERFVASVARALKTNGTVVVIDFEPGSLWLHGGRPDDNGRRPGHGVSRPDTVAEFATAGFVVTYEVPQWSGPMWLVALRRDGSH